MFDFHTRFTALMTVASVGGFAAAVTVLVAVAAESIPVMGVAGIIALASGVSALGAGRPPTQSRQ